MFKRFLLSLAFLAMSVVAVTYAEAITWHTANQATLGWIPPTKYTDGTDIPAGVVLNHEVYSSLLPDKSDKVLLGRSETNEYTFTLNSEGGNIIGVRAVRVDYGTDPAGEDVAFSVISWSDDSSVCENGVDFGVRYFLVPDFPMGLYNE